MKDQESSQSGNGPGAAIRSCLNLKPDEPVDPHALAALANSGDSDCARMARTVIGALGGGAETEK